LSIRYELTALVLGRAPPTVSLEPAEFEAIGRAVDGLRDIFWIEEIYDAVTQNYRAYEEGQVLITLAHALGSEEGWEEIDDARRGSARLLDNLLSTARAFLDSAPQRMRSIGGDALMAAFKTATSRVYDDSRAYRFMDALRNYSQHRGSSISAMTFDHKRQPAGEDGKDFKLVYSIRPRLRVDDVEMTFKTKVQPLLQALKDDQGMIDITPLVREYLVGLNQIMLETRGLIAPFEAGFYAVQNDAVSRLGAVWPEALDYPVAVKLQGEDELVSHFLAISQPERTGRLRKRNGKIAHLPRLQLIS
jgi:hypothetical protein